MDNTAILQDQTDDATTAIRLTDLRFEYQPRRRPPVLAIDDVNLEIRRGEFLSVVGPSGCGKSTLLRVLCGLQRPTGGKALIEHQDPTKPLVAPVFQEYSIFPWRTVEQNIRLGLDARGVPREISDAKVSYWLEKVGLAGYGDKYPSSLSGGMKQRVALARALVLEPEILLMDEPFAALDAQMRQILQEELLEIVRENQYTVFFVTHNLDEAILLSDRVALMSARPGRIRHVFDVPLERPRTSEMRLEQRFTELEAEIWGLLRHEVLAGIQESGA